MTWPTGDPNQPPRPQPPYAPPPPPPLPYQQPYQQAPQQYPYGQQPPGGYPYPEPKKSRKGLVIALVAVGVVILVGIIAVAVLVFVVAKDQVVATDLAVGDCLTDIPDSTLVSMVPKVDCAQPHSGEVYAVLKLPDGDYPGAATIDTWQNKCPGELQSYSSDAMADESVGVFVLYPTAETWAQGDRAITCIATTDDKRTGSVKG